MPFKIGRGPRVSVVIEEFTDDYGRLKRGVVRPKKGTQEYFGLVPKTLYYRNKKNGLYRVRGEKGSGSVKFVLFDGKPEPPTDENAKPKITYVSVPIPNDFTIRDACRWSQTFPQNKPKFIITPDGIAETIEALLNAEIVEGPANSAADRAKDAADVAKDIADGNILGTGPNSPGRIVPDKK